MKRKLSRARGEFLTSNRLSPADTCDSCACESESHTLLKSDYNQVVQRSMKTVVLHLLRILYLLILFSLARSAACRLLCQLSQSQEMKEIRKEERKHIKKYCVHFGCVDNFVGRRGYTTIDIEAMGIEHLLEMDLETFKVQSKTIGIPASFVPNWIRFSFECISITEIRRAIRVNSVVLYVILGIERAACYRQSSPVSPCTDGMTNARH